MFWFNLVKIQCRDINPTKKIEEFFRFKKDVFCWVLIKRIKCVYFTTSLGFGDVTTMAFKSSGVVYIVAFGATPVIRTRYIIWKPITSAFPLTRFALVASLATITEIKIQKVAFWTVPFPRVIPSLTTMTSMTTTVSTVTTTLPTSWIGARTWTGTISFHFFFIGLLINVGKDTL